MSFKKKLCYGLLGVISLLTIASCKKEEPPVIEPFDPNPVTSEETLSSISLNTENAKTNYYIGETFTTEGLEVVSNYVVYKDGRPTSVQKECKDYYVDSSLVDMSHAGEYPVTIVYRLGTIKVSSAYKVNVRSSVLEASNEKYISGLEVKYGSTTEFFVDDEFNFRTNALTIRAHYFQGAEEVEVKTIGYNKIKIDSSAVDTSKVGTYVIKYSISETLTIQGSAYENEVSAFTIVTVVNPTTSIELVSGSLSLEASILGLDTSDWKIKINRMRRDPEIVDFTDELFNLKNVVPYLVAEQNVRIEWKEDPLNIFIDLTINVTESDKYSIVTATELSKVEDKDGKIQLDEAGKLFVPSGVTMTEGRHTDKYGVITFAERVTIKGAAQPLEVHMDAPGILVLYIASSGDESREITMYDPNGEEVESFMTASTKQTITEVHLTVEQAGVYKVINPASGVYIHGCILAMEKVAK